MYAGRVFQLVLAAGLLVSAGAASGEPMGTAFTYQGELLYDEAVVNSPCDLQFSLYDADAGGDLVAGPLQFSGVAISEGRFTVQLDFGKDAFPGNARWLEIAVGCPGDDELITLAPRQELTPTPHALQASGNWSRTGNAGTDPEVSFLGTTDNHPLIFKVNNEPALRIEPSGSRTCSTPNVVWWAWNGVLPPWPGGVCGAVISGGGSTTIGNWVYDDFGTVSGGEDNQAGSNDGTETNARHATVGGGTRNEASAVLAVVGGGDSNKATGPLTTVSGGGHNTANGTLGTIGGGERNKASGGRGATVGGGGWNYAQALYGTISGGRNNIIYPGGTGDYDPQPADYGTIGGGRENEVGLPVGPDTCSSTSRMYATVGGGQGNKAMSGWCTIAGGWMNKAGGKEEL